MPKACQVSALISAFSSDLVGELVNRRERLVENVVKELAERHAAHESSQAEALIDWSADPGSQPDVQRRRRGLRRGGGHGCSPVVRLGHR
jgi:hypothetical protein